MLYVILSAPAPQVLVNLPRMLPAMYAVRMQIRAERSDKTIFLTQLPLLGSVAKNVMPLYSILTGVHTVVHVICKDAP